MRICKVCAATPFLGRSDLIAMLVEGAEEFEHALQGIGSPGFDDLEFIVLATFAISREQSAIDRLTKGRRSETETRSWLWALRETAGRHYFDVRPQGILVGSLGIGPQPWAAS